MQVRQRAKPHPTGTTLSEMLVALTVFGIVGATAVQTLHVSSRWYERSTLVVEQRAQLDAARRLLATLPAAASPGDGDLTALSDSAITWQATIGSAAVCNLTPASVVLPRAPLVSGVAVASFESAPQPGDQVLLLHDGPTQSLQDDRWMRASVTAVHSAPGACVGGPLADSVIDASTPAWRLDLVPAPSPTGLAMMAVLLRPQRLALYQSSGEWMLGFAEANGIAGWNIIQPAAGPLSGPALPGPGIDLHWLDSLLVPTGTSVAMVSATLRAPTRRNVRPLSGPSAPIVDSLGFIVAFHNWR